MKTTVRKAIAFILATILIVSPVLADDYLIFEDEVISTETAEVFEDYSAGEEEHSLPDDYSSDEDYYSSGDADDYSSGEDYSFEDEYETADDTVSLSNDGFYYDESVQEDNSSVDMMLDEAYVNEEDYSSDSYITEEEAIDTSIAAEEKSFTGVKITEEIIDSVSIDSSVSNNELFAEYVDQMFGISKPSLKKRRASTTSMLNDAEREIYNILSGYIQEVASGERSSTIFEISVKDVFGADTWTPDELGVDNIWDSDENITEEASAAAADKVKFNLDLVNMALLEDFPYHLYWYDKTKNIKRGYRRVHCPSYVQIETITVKMAVAEAYSGGGDYVVNTSIGDAVNHAVEKAASIVEQHKNESDLEKLQGYKDDICGLVAYNHTAAGGGIPYGDPWQLIWVFDENESTDVVCEGYSKAFKYLCDQSVFNSDIQAITVYGDMDGGGHMWNVVKMGDGYNYLVDVTNCDEGTIGSPDYLFLAGASEQYENADNRSTGYTINYKARWGNEEVEYIYDGDMFGLFSDSDLRLNSFSYNEQYTVTFDTDGGTPDTIPSQIIAYGGKATKPEDPEKEGYLFGGWFNGESLFDFTQEITSDVELKARWNAKESISATVTFKVVNGFWDDGSKEYVTVTLTGLEGDTLKLSSNQIPAVGNNPDDGYKAGSWDVTPSTDAAITKDTTYTYTYAAIGTIKVTVPTAKDLIYNGKAQELISPVTASVGTVEYTLDGDWSTAIPTGKDAGIYTVHYRATASGYYDAEGSVTAEIRKKDVTVSGITAEDKYYDGNTDATLDYSKAIFNGKLEGDSLSVTATGAFENASIGENKTVIIGGLTLGGSSDGNYQLLSSGNQISTKASIIPKPLTVNAQGYNGTYDGEKHSITVSAEEGATISYTTSEKGTYTTTNPSFTDAGTYTVYYKVNKTGSSETTGSEDVQIDQKSVTVSGITAEDKEYDGTTDATLIYEGVVIDGLVEGDHLTVTATGTFEDSEIGYDKTVWISDLTLGGATAKNYQLLSSGNQISTKASIIPKPLNVNAQGYSGVYDGNAHSITVTANSGATITYATEESGTYNKTNPSFKDAGTYTVFYKVTKSGAIGEAGHETVDIQKRDVTVSGITAEDKEYDGTTDATLIYEGVVIDGLVEGDRLTVTATGTFEDAEIGFDKTVWISNLTLGGAGAKNYQLTDYQTETTASIVVQQFQLTINACNGTYNGKKTSTINCFSGQKLSDILNPENLKSSDAKKEFSYWSTDQKGKNPVDPDTFVIDGNMTLYAQYRQITFTVILDANEGFFGSPDETTFSTTALKGKKLSALPKVDPTCQDKDKCFVGWALDPDGTERIANLKNYIPTGNMTIFAVYDDHVLKVIPGVAATCLKAGKTEGSYCTRCKKNIVEVEVIDALGHDEYIIEGTPATCTKTGLTDGRNCSRCGKVIEAQKKIPLKDHNWEEGYTEDLAPTCTKTGKESIHCADCGAIKKGSSRTLDKTPHTYGEWTVIKEPTCTKKGTKSNTCAICKHTEKKDIPALGHDWSEDYTVDKQPTCKAAGSQSHHCTRCNAKEPKSDVAIPKADHVAGDWVVTKKPTTTAAGTKVKKCKYCSKVLESEVIDMLPKQEQETFTVTAKTPSVKASALAKKAQTITATKAFTVKNAKGKVSYARVSGDDQLTISSAGVITVAKGTAAGDYQITVDVTAAGDKNYNPKTEQVTVTVTVN